MTRRNTTNETAVFPTAPPAESPPEREDYSPLIRRVLGGGRLDDIRDSPTFLGLIQCLRSDRDFLASRQLAAEAEIADFAMRRVQQMFAAFQRNTFQIDTVAKLWARYAAAKEEFDRVQEIARVQEESFIGTLNEQMRQLEEQQRREVDGLVEKWRSPNKVRLFNRASPELRNLRTRQRMQLNTQRYDLMHMTQHEADDLEARETAEMQRVMMTSYSAALQILEAKHSKQVGKLQSVHEQKIEDFKRARKADFDIMENRLGKLKRAYELAQDQKELWNVRRHNDYEALPREYATTPQRHSRLTEITCDFNTLKLEAVPVPRTQRRHFRRTKC
jgi:hypothetical protein